MYIIKPNYILTPDTLLEGMSVAFDKTIKKIAAFDELKKEFASAEVIELQENSLLMPGLINLHVHVEFSANKTTLSYGDFINWLYSVIENRTELINGCEEKCMNAALEAMLESGITTVGAVSSHGLDLQACADAKQNVVFFNELIGSQASMADVLFGDFVSRLESSKAIKREGFYPAVAVHSPYSVHPVLVKKALEVVKEEKLRLSAHFMESDAEREWLDKGGGDFKEFFEKLLKQENPLCASDEFLGHFDDTPTLFTHVVKANPKELEVLSSNSHTVVHCPISNRLLGNGTLDIKELDERGIRWVLATDGLSSNYGLDLFEEMKAALFMHSSVPLLGLADKLIKSVTKDAADALGLKSGEIAEGKSADMIVLDLDAPPSDELAIHLILHRYNISKVYINGISVKG